MVTILPTQGTTFKQYALLPGYTPTTCIPSKISLATKLAEGLEIPTPLLSAAMTSVTDYELSLALGREGGMPILPLKLPTDRQADIVQRIKSVEMGFVDDPITVRETATVAKALSRIEKYGHSKVPVVSRYGKFLGLFVQQQYLDNEQAGPEDNIRKAMVSYPSEGLRVVNNPDLSAREAEEIFAQNGVNYIVILDAQERLVKLAFKRDFSKIRIGAAISTYTGWQERAEANIAAGVDMLVIDTSDGYSEFVERTVKDFKEVHRYPVPLCAGNVVTYEGAKFLMSIGADVVKVGMSSGSICTTKREKAVGRAPMTALLECARARDDHYRETGRYVPIIMDGGIEDAADMVIALTVADALMMGGWFNHFYEAAGEKFDRDLKVTTDEERMAYVATWGEASPRAANLERYGHRTKKAFFAEGIEGKVEYWGRLKPRLKTDLAKVRAAMSNVGAHTLAELREKATLEQNSAEAEKIIGASHNVKT